MAENSSGIGSNINNPAAPASSTSRSNSPADSYIGSLISLTSKSEIRYEGVLYNINTDESSIGLKNVRSFGTEGRKKDGPQIPPGDKVYEYILFRGSDIKDLQVKSSPPVQPAPPINNDPAIIQSHYARPVSTATSMPSAVSGTLTDLGSHNAQVGLPGSNFQGGLPLYQPGGNMGTWGASPPQPNANGSGLAMPMYWQGYYGPPPNGPQLHQQPLLRPPHGLAMPPSMQHPMQYPTFNAPLPTGAPNMPISTFQVSLPDAPSPFLPASTTSLNFTSTPLASSTLPSAPMLPSATLASEILPSLLPNKAGSASLHTANLGASLPSLSSFPTSIQELSATVAPNLNRTNAVSVQTMPYQSLMHSTTSSVTAPTSLRTEAPTPPLVTPAQLLPSGSITVPSSQPVQAAHKDVEVVQVSSSSQSEPLLPAATEPQPPILPLPAPSRANHNHKPNGAPFHARHGYQGRERGRGTGSSRPLTKFTEDFDFMAMNEKFKKDEVWGHLGKNNTDVSGEDNLLDGDGDDELAEREVKQQQQQQPVYNKDDFFDSLSSNALDNQSQSGRHRFSEQMKIDTETFGEFSRYRGGRGGRGPPRGGRGRGSYNGRGYGGYGYGYGGRGRGRAMPGGRAPPQG